MFKNEELEKLYAKENEYKHNQHENRAMRRGKKKPKQKTKQVILF